MANDTFGPTGAKPLMDLFLAKLADSLNAPDTEVSGVTRETVLNVSDILLSVGGPTAWAMAGADYMGKVSEEHAAKLRDLSFVELIGKDGKSRWELSSPEAEIEFLAWWLEAADNQGREIKPEARQGIERWIEFNRNLTKAPRRTGASYEPIPTEIEASPFPEKRVPYADEVRAKEARQAATRPSAHTQDEIQDALIRRRRRLGR